MAAVKLVNLRKVRLALQRVEMDLPHAYTPPTWHPVNHVGVQVRKDVVAALATLTAYLDRETEATP